MFDRTNIHWPLEVEVRPATDIEPDDLSEIFGEFIAGQDQFMAILDRGCESVLIGGYDERQLEENLEILRSNIPFDVETDTPQVGYRETIRKPVEIDYTHKKQTGGSGQYARMKVQFEPLEAGGGFVFESALHGTSIPREFVPGIKKGMEQQRESGTVAGFPVIDFKATVVDGASHDVDSSVMAFEIAARACLREALDKATPRLLEPILKMEVVIPDDYVHDLVKDLNSRRGAISGIKGEDGVFTVAASVPAARIFGFPNALEHLTQGRGSYSVQFSHYEPVSDGTDEDPLWPEAASGALRA